MLQFEINRSAVIVDLHGVEYQITKPQDVKQFKADMGWYFSIDQLVAAYLDKLVRVVKRIASAVIIAAVNACQAAAGHSKLSFWQEQKLRWCN